jgi:hypothetical protein
MSRKTSSRNKVHISMTSGRLDSLLSKPLSSKDKKTVEEMRQSFIAFGVLNGRQNSQLTRIEGRYAT